MTATAPAPAPAPAPTPSPGQAAAGRHLRAGPVFRLGRVVGRHRLLTPTWLRLAMVVMVVPAALFAVAVRVGVARNDEAVRTVGKDATGGITSAQLIKLDLAELDGIVAADLLRPETLSASGFPDDYNVRRRRLESTLVRAASSAPVGAAYQQPLADLGYALGHYHALVKEAFAVQARGSADQSSVLYGRAHAVMSGTLLRAADSFDKANTYLLNLTYQSHKADSAAKVRLIVWTFLLLLGVLGGLQLLLVRQFHRMVNLPLAIATACALGAGALALGGLHSSAGSLTKAREQSFDPVHELARARATVVSARQAEAQILLAAGDPAADAGFAAARDELFRVPAGRDLASDARSGQVPEGAGGLLARAFGSNPSAALRDASQSVLERLAAFVDHHADLRQRVAARDLGGALALFEDRASFDALAGAVDRAQADGQAAFDRQAGAAADATAALAGLVTLAAIAVVVLTALGLAQRRAEYRGAR